MSTPHHSFANYLEKVRRMTWQRLSARALVLWVSASLWLVTACGLYSTWSGRGDLARVLCVAGIALAAWVCSCERWTSFGRRAPTIDLCAKAIAEVPDHKQATLRQDIAAAWSLSSQTSVRGSPALRDLYLRRVEARLVELKAADALPPLPSTSVWAALTTGALCFLFSLTFWTSGYTSLWSGEDTRPPLPPNVFWRSLGLKLTFPEKAQRPARHLEPVAGQLNLPVGTQVQVTVKIPPNERFSWLALQDRKAQWRMPLTPSSKNADGQPFSAVLTVEKPLQLELVGVDKESSRHRPKHGAAFSIAALQDKAPQIELAPGPSTQRSDRNASLPVTIHAQDDFGLRSLSLHYQSPGQPPAWIPIELKGQPKRYKDTFIWNLSSVPVEQRSDLIYWIEARDNDTKINPKDQRPGNTSKTSPRTLIVEDARAQHQRLLRQLAALRDEAVDLLALQMQPTLARQGMQDRLGQARNIEERSTRFLSNLASLISALDKDKFAARSTRRVLAQVHQRSQERHELSAPILRFIYANQRLKPRVQNLLNTPWPEENAPKYPRAVPLNNERVTSALQDWTQLLPGTRSRLEDDILRLDDMVDAELMDQLEALMTALKKAQKKLVRWLDALDMSDPKSKTRVEQLQARIKLDMQRIQELQALLRDEVDPGFFNQDALAELAARMNHQSIKQKLDNGDVEGAKKAAKSQLSKMESVQKDMQKKGPPSEHLSPKEKAQRYLRRRLAQLNDQQADLETQTPQNQRPSAHDLERDRNFAKDIQEQLSKVKDTQLNKPGRKALQAAQDALEDLKDSNSGPKGRHLAAEQLRHHLKQALLGTPASERSRLSTLVQKSHAHADATPSQAEPPDQVRRRVQETLAKKLRAIGNAPQSREGMTSKLQQYLDEADTSMKDSAKALDRGRRLRSRLAQQAAQRKIESALDELRQAPPPPPPTGSQEVSMQAKQDKTLREAVLEALEKDSKSLHPDARAYYESLLEP